MVSTYLSYSLVSRNMQTSLSRVASESQVSRETQYFKDNIGKVKTVDDFMNDYRLYSYAMSAYGLDDMTYAKAFMRKVLSSDLTDSSSFANQLSDQKYRDFAAAFKFTAATATPQTSSQEQTTLQNYKDQIAQEGDNAATETAYYKATIGSVTTVDGLIGNSRLYTYAMKAVGVDPDTYSASFIRQILTSDTSSSSSTLNALASSDLKSKLTILRNAFNFGTDGTLPSGTAAQTSTQISTITDDYVLSVPSHVTAQAADLNKSYIESAMAKVTKVSDITSDDRLFTLVKTALGLSVGTMASTFQNIVTDRTYAKQQGGDTYTAVYDMFNFDSDGNVKSTTDSSGATTAGTAMTSTNLAALENKYMSTYSADDDSTDNALYTYYQAGIGRVKSVDDLMNTTRLYDFALQAVGLDANTESSWKIKQVLESDVNDPNSYVNTLGDKRYVELAKSYNFGKDGKITDPKTAQSEAEIEHMSKNYIFQKDRFLTGDALAAAKKTATAEATYYTDKVQGISTVNDLLSDSRMVNFMLTSVGLDPSKVSKDTLKQVFSSDLSNPNSYANKMSDPRYAQLVAAFNLNTSGTIKDMDPSPVMSRRAEFEMVDKYYNQTLESEEGDSDTGVRLALYFKREAPNISSAYDILADSALLQVFKTTYGLSDSFSSLDIDSQADKVKQLMTLSDLADPDKLDKFVNRFAALYDMANSTTTSATALLSGSTSISADTLMTIAQLKSS